MKIHSTTQPTIEQVWNRDWANGGEDLSTHGLASTRLCEDPSVHDKHNEQQRQCSHSVGIHALHLRRLDPSLTGRHHDRLW